MIEIAQETFTDRRTAYNTKEIDVSWTQITDLPHIHFHLYPHDRIVEVLTSWHDRQWVIAVNGGNMIYHFAVSTWDELVVILKHYLRPVVD